MKDKYPEGHSRTEYIDWEPIAVVHRQLPPVIALALAQSCSSMIVMGILQGDGGIETSGALKWLQLESTILLPIFCILGAIVLSALHWRGYDTTRLP